MAKRLIAYLISTLFVFIGLLFAEGLRRDPLPPRDIAILMACFVVGLFAGDVVTIIRRGVTRKDDHPARGRGK